MSGDWNSLCWYLYKYIIINTPMLMIHAGFSEFDKSTKKLGFLFDFAWRMCACLLLVVKWKWYRYQFVKNTVVKSLLVLIQLLNLIFIFIFTLNVNIKEAVRSRPCQIYFEFEYFPILLWRALLLKELDQYSIYKNGTQLLSRLKIVE